MKVTDDLINTVVRRVFEHQGREDKVELLAIEVKKIVLSDDSRSLVMEYPEVWNRFIIGLTRLAINEAERQRQLRRLP